MHEIRINLDEELYYKVKEEAAKKDMNLSEYFRDLLMKQSGVELTIDFADVYRYVEQIEQLTRFIFRVIIWNFPNNIGLKQIKTPQNSPKQNFLGNLLIHDLSSSSACANSHSPQNCS